MKTAYFILGMHRSGTSALSGVLNILGVSAGSNLLPANDTNPKGYFENKAVYWFNETQLKEYKSSWRDPLFNVDIIKGSEKIKIVEEATAILKAEYNSFEHFIIKDPRICLLFPIWEEACLSLNYKIKIIVPYRNPLEVAESLKSRNGFSTEKGILLWLTHFYAAEYFSRKYSRIFLNFDDLLDNTKTYLKQLTPFLNKTITQSQTEKIGEFLEKDYKHINIPLKEFGKRIPKFLIKTIKALKTTDFDNLERMDCLRNEFYYSLRLFQQYELKDKEEENKNLTNHSTSQHNKVLELSEQNNTLVEYKKQLEQVEKELTLKKKGLADALNTESHLLQDIDLINSRNNKLEKHVEELSKSYIKMQQVTTSKAKQSINQLTQSWLNFESKLKNIKSKQFENIKNQQQLLQKSLHDFNQHNSVKLSVFAYLNPAVIINRAKRTKKAKQQLKTIEEKFNRIDEKVIKNFNTKEYLLQNTDVNLALLENEISNAIEHFISHGFDEVYAGSRLLYQNNQLYNKSQESNNENNFTEFNDYLSDNNRLINNSLPRPEGFDFNLKLFDEINQS